MVGDRRPYLIALITLDPEEAPAFAEEHGLDVEDLPDSELMRAEVQKVVDEVNGGSARSSRSRGSRSSTTISPRRPAS